MSVENSQGIKEVVKEKYGEAALRVMQSGSKASCCGSGAVTGIALTDPITQGLYDLTETSELRNEAVLASLGCGNPTALAKLNRGETVLDLGSGAASTCCFQPSA